MTRNERLDKLFEGWEPKYGSTFVRDGIRDDKLWETAQPRILFLLKEANQYPGGDLRKLELQRTLWRQAGMWVDAIERTDRTRIPEFLPASNDDGLWRRSVQRSAIMNLKKPTGGGSSNMDEIRVFAIEDREFLSEQLGIIDPHIVICCGDQVFHIAQGVFDLSPPSHSGFRWIRDRGILWIDFYHPSGRYPQFMCYYSLAKVYQEALAGTS